MSLWKRSTIYIVVLMVLLSCFTSSVSAAASDENIISLMSPVNDYKVTSYAGSSYKVNANCFSLTKLTKANLFWTTEVSPKVNEIYITLHSSVSLPYITVQVNGADVPVRSVKYGSSYFLTISTPNTFVEKITIALGWSSAVTGKVSIASAYAFYDEFFAYSSALMYTQDFLFMADSDELYRTAYENKQATSLPAAAFNHITNYASEPVDPLLNGLVWIYNLKDDLPFDRADSITYLLTTCGSINTDELSFCLVDNAGNPKLVLPASKVSTIIRNTSAYFGSEDMQWPVYTYTITVDTSELDLNYYYGYALHFWIDPVDVYYDQWTGWYFQLASIVARPLQSTVPWYARFGNWINSGFDRVVAALRGDSEASKLANASDAMVESANDIKAAGDALGEVSQPDVNTDDMFSDMVSFDPVGLTVLSCITSNPIVSSMLVVVFTFCLAGYIFFGKKG